MRETWFVKFGASDEIAHITMHCTLQEIPFPKPPKRQSFSWQPRYLCHTHTHNTSICTILQSPARINSPWFLLSLPWRISSFRAWASVIRTCSNLLGARVCMRGLAWPLDHAHKIRYLPWKILSKRNIYKTKVGVCVVPWVSCGDL